MKLNFKISKICNFKFNLAESPVYDENNKILFIIDINKKILFEYNLENKKHNKIKFDQKIGFAKLLNKKTLVLGFENKIIYFDILKKKTIKIFSIKKFSKNLRTNDGDLDKNKNIFFGMYDKKKKYNGGLFVFNSRTKKFSKILGRLNTPNGPCFDKKKMNFYFTDTSKKMIYFFFKKKNLFQKKIFKDLSYSLAHNERPDGMTIDKKNNLWVCFYGSNYIRVYNKYSKEILKIKFPCKNITNCTFDNSYKNLFVTTARAKLSNQEKKENPDSGSIFVLNIK